MENLTPKSKTATSPGLLPMKDSDPDYPALLAGNFILGGGAISSRIADRLRKQDEKKVEEDEDYQKLLMEIQKDLDRLGVRAELLAV